MNISFSKTCHVPRSFFGPMTKAAEIALDKEGFSHEEKERTEISVTFLSSDKIKKLNNTYRGVDKITDVLSFPMYDDLTVLPEEGEIQLGDVVINKEVAEAQAEEYGHSYKREMVYLFTHSILHLLGYDHEDKEEKKVMRKREEEIMEEIGIER